MVNNINYELSMNRSIMPSPVYVDPSLSIPSDYLGSHVSPLKSQDITQSRQQLVQAGQQFESYFISYLLKVMRETVHEGAIANKQGAYFYSFYDQEIGVRAAESGGIGIARMVQEYAEKYFSGPSVERSSSLG
jgi:peptidoglycan hydrolase FlgJ